jgi:ATP-dependent Zn protease
VDLSPGQLDAIDTAVRKLLAEAARRAAAILRKQRPIVELLRDELLKYKVIEAQTLKTMLAANSLSTDH